MNLNEYQFLAQRTSKKKAERLEKIENGVLGLCGESGECADMLKKYLHQGHKFDADKMADEVGDVLWYVAETAAGLVLTLEEIAQRNIAKLNARYPDGFDPERSVHRPEYEHAEKPINIGGSAPAFLFEMRNKTI